MSSLVLGTAQFGLDYGINNSLGQVKIDQVLEILLLAYKNGVTELDTAQAYGNSEQILKECFKKLDFDFTVHSKFIDKNVSLKDSLQESLNNLEVPRLGYFYFHHFDDYLKNREKLLQTNEILENCLGLAVSLYDDNELELVVNDSLIKAIQVPMNIFDCSDKKVRLISQARKKGKKIYIRSVFLQGLFFMDEKALPTKLKSLSIPLQKAKSIAHENKINMKSLALGFVKGLVETDGVIIGVDTKEQLQENIDAWKNDLNPNILAQLKQIEILDKALLLPKNWN